MTIDIHLLENASGQLRKAVMVGKIAQIPKAHRSHISTEF